MYVHNVGLYWGTPPSGNNHNMLGLRLVRDQDATGRFYTVGYASVLTPLINPIGILAG